MLHTHTILNTFLSNYTRTPVTWIQLGITERDTARRGHPPSALEPALDTSQICVPTFPFWECGLTAVHW